MMTRFGLNVEKTRRRAPELPVEKKLLAELQALLRRAEGYALLLNDKTGEGQIQCCLGAILRRLGKAMDAGVALLKSQLSDSGPHLPDQDDRESTRAPASRRI